MFVSISGISPYNVYNVIGIPAQNTAGAPKGLDAISPAMSNLQEVERTGVLQANQALAQSLLGLTNPEPPLEALLSASSNLQAVQRSNATEHNPGRTQYFFTAYFNMMNMPASPITGSTVNITA